ncbi:MAG: hypothetical protein DMF54_15710 [Acidobacteria bacterium]|nr:MAG: hypothetical protein DMF54_15710 [Acidobacteriota bacterium]
MQTVVVELRREQLRREVPGLDVQSLSGEHEGDVVPLFRRGLQSPVQVEMGLPFGGRTGREKKWDMFC